MWIRKSLTILAICAVAVRPATASHDSAGVSINGQVLNRAQLAQIEARIGSRVEPGNYLYDRQTGCWANLSTGRRGCLGSSGSYTSRYGSGGYDSGGSWSHHSDLAGGSVGGSGDGCVYAFGWSNC